MFAKLHGRRLDLGADGGFKPDIYKGNSRAPSDVLSAPALSLVSQIPDSFQTFSDGARTATADHRRMSDPESPTNMSKSLRENSK